MEQPLRLTPTDVRQGLADLDRHPGVAAGVTLDATRLPGDAAGLIAAAFLCGTALLDHPGIAVVMPGADAAEQARNTRELYAAAGFPVPGVTLVACPTCARAALDIVTLAERIHRRVAPITTPLRVAVMGCEVNGPGEARDCDCGIAGGKGRGLLFKHGEPLKTVPEAELEGALVALIEELTGERCAPASPVI